MVLVVNAPRKACLYVQPMLVFENALGNFATRRTQIYVYGWSSRTLRLPPDRVAT